MLSLKWTNPMVDVNEMYSILYIILWLKGRKQFGVRALNLNQDIFQLQGIVC